MAAFVVKTNMAHVEDQRIAVQIGHIAEGSFGGVVAAAVGRKQVKAELTEHIAQNQTAAPHTGVEVGVVKLSAGKGKFAHAAADGAAVAYNFGKNAVEQRVGGLKLERKISIFGIFFGSVNSAEVGIFDRNQQFIT